MKVRILLLLLTISATAVMAQQTGGSGVPGAGTGGGGASIPATATVLKGSGTAGSAVAATAGTDYLSPSLATAQTLAGPLNAPQVGTIFHVDGFPSSCTVSSVNYTTQLDCAFYSAVAAGATAIVLGTNRYATPYTTCAGLVEPATGAQVSIIGQVEGDNVTPTEIKATCAMQAVIAHADVLTSQSEPYNMSIHNINIDANNLAQQCVALYAEKVGHSEHVHCRNALSSTLAPVQFGDTRPAGGYQGIGYQYELQDILVTGTGNGPTSWASLTASQTGGVPSITVNTAGSYLNAAPPAYLLGFGAGANPCSTMGTATANMAGSGPYTVASVTLSGFSGCAGTLYAYVPDIAPGTYGIETAMTDSTFQDLVVANYGRIAGIHHANGSNQVIHDHVYGGSLVDVLNSNPNSFTNEEADTPFHYGIEDDSGKGQFTATEFVWAGGTPLAGASGFYQGGGGLNIDGSNCGGTTSNSNGFNLVVTPSGPVAHGAGVTYNGNVVDAVQCDNLAYVNYVANPTMGATAVSTLTALGQITNAANGAASAPAVNVTGAPYSGGTATTAFPLFYLNCSGSTGVTTFSTAGTFLGVNACSGFTGHFINFFANGGSTRFRVDSVGDLFAAGTTTLASTLAVNGDTAFSAGPRAFLAANTGSLSAVAAGAQFSAYKVVKAGTLENVEGTASGFTCSANPTLTLEDCGTTAGSCASPTALGSVTLTAANTVTDGTIANATLTAGHYLAWETTGGTCTSVALSASAEYRLN